MSKRKHIEKLSAGRVLPTKHATRRLPPARPLPVKVVSPKEWERLRQAGAFGPEGGAAARFLFHAVASTRRSRSAGPQQSRCVR